MPSIVSDHWSRSMRGTPRWHWTKTSCVRVRRSRIWCGGSGSRLKGPCGSNLTTFMAPPDLFCVTPFLAKQYRCAAPLVLERCASRVFPVLVMSRRRKSASSNDLDTLDSSVYKQHINARVPMQVVELPTV